MPDEPKTMKDLPVHNMHCKNQSCDSMQVVELPYPARTGTHLYRCIKCNTTWGVPTGGSVDIG